MEDYRHGPSASGASAPSPVPALEQPRHIPVESAQFDIFDWHPAYTSCQRFFLDHAQHEHSVRAVCALINIKLPCQWTEGPIPSAEASVPSRRDSVPFQTFQRREQAQDEKTTALNWVSLVPYVRRLVVTGFDREAVMHGMFGDDWRKGIGPVQECERRNYLFAAKSGGWLHVKSQYDMGPQETVPFLQPPQSIAVGASPASHPLRQLIIRRFKKFTMQRSFGVSGWQWKTGW